MKSKDILYITEQTIKDLYKLCEINLVSSVLNHFHQNGGIIIKKDNEKPSRFWDITNYITNNVLKERHKLSVILSFAYIGGFIQINEQKALGYENVLRMLKEMFYLSDEEHEYFLDKYSSLKRGEKVKFTL